MKRSRVVGLAALVAAVGIAGWLAAGRRPAEGAHPAITPAVPVTVAVAKVQDVPIYAEGLGTVQAINSVNVKTRVDGQIMKAFFAQGQEVKPGDPLFLIDPRPFEAALHHAQATRQKDQAQLQGAQLDLARYGKLVGSGYQTRQSYDDQTATVGQLEAAVKADEAAIETATLNLQYTVIRAPIGGRTGALMVDPGNLVQASSETTLVSITQMQPIYVRFTLPQGLLDQIRQAQAQGVAEVDAYNAASSKLLATGRLSFIDNHVDAATGTVTLEGTFTNTDERLWPGAFVTVRLIMGTRRNVVTVPVQTVMTGPDGPYVYVVGPGDTVQQRAVKVAARQDGLAVISSGVHAAETVVVGGQYRLSDGARVQMDRASGTQPGLSG